MKFLGRHSALAGCVFLALITFAVFSGSLGNRFVNWDDGMFIIENSNIRGLDSPHIHRMFTTLEVGAYTPLSQLSLALDYATWKLDPFGYHLTSLLLHCANAILVFWIARLLLDRALGSSRPTLNNLGALAAALLFSIHPMRVESVAWASERRDVLSGFFGLAATLCYILHARARSAPNNVPLSRSLAWYPLAFVLFLCAVISKAVVVTLPVAFLLMDVYPFHRLSMRAVAEKIPFFLISLVTGIGTFLAIFSADLGVTIQHSGMETRAAQSLVANHIYLSKIFIPLDLNPLDKLQQTFHFNQQIVWAGFAVSGILTLIFLGCYRRHQAPLIAWLAWLAIIFPFLGVSQSGFQLTADRYTYLAAIPLCILLGGIMARALRACPESELFSGGRARPPGAPLRSGQPGGLSLPKTGIFGHALGRIEGVDCARRRIVMLASAGCILAWLGYLTTEQVKIWRDSETLWKYSLRIDSKNPVAWQNYGDALFNQGDRHAAISAFEQSLHWAPRSYETWYNYGLALDTVGRHDDAMAAMRRTVELYDRYDLAHFLLGNFLLQQGDRVGARREYFASIWNQPVPAHLTSLGMVLIQTGHPDLAIKYLSHAAQQGNPQAYCVWATLLAQRHETAKALDLLEAGYRRTHHPDILVLALTILEKDRSLSEKYRSEKSEAFWSQSGIF